MPLRESTGGSSTTERALALIERAGVPTLPAVAMRAAELARDVNSQTSEIVRLVNQDPSLTSRVLKLANSAYYAVPRGVADVRKAVSYLGLNTLYQLVLTVSILQSLPRQRDGALDAVTLWRHSLVCAHCARELGRKLRLAPEDMFTAGLLHDIGKIIVACADGEGLEAACELAEAHGVGLFEAERMRDGRGQRTDHEQVGRLAARRWRLPPHLVAAIGFHHSAEQGNAARVMLIGEQRRIAAVVRVADWIAHLSGNGDGCVSAKPDTPEVLLDELSIKPREVEVLVGQVPRALQSSKAFLELLDDDA